MIWQEESERTALLHFKYEMFVLVEGDFRMLGRALKILKSPREEK